MAVCILAGKLKRAPFALLQKTVLGHQFTTTRPITNTRHGPAAPQTQTSTAVALRVELLRRLETPCWSNLGQLLGTQRASQLLPKPRL